MPQVQERVSTAGHIAAGQDMYESGQRDRFADLADPSRRTRPPAPLGGKDRLEYLAPISPR